MSQIQVQIRGHQIATVSELSEVTDGVFIALPEPPPVRSFLRLLEDGKDARALEVVRVVELEDPARDQMSGVVCRYIGLDELEAGRTIGTEHLEGGVASADADGPQLAVPSPVVDPDPSAAIAVDELERLEATGAANDSSGDDAAPDKSATDDSSDDGGSKKKRRGRKRR